MMTKLSNEHAVAAFAHLQSLRNAQSEAVAYWAVHSVTGAHIGLWEDETYARNVLKEYADGTITPLYTHPAPPLAVTDEQTIIDAYLRGTAWRDENPGEDNSPYRFKAARDYADKTLTAALEAKQ